MIRAGASHAVAIIGFFADLVQDLLRSDPDLKVLVVEEADILRTLDPNWHHHPRVSFRAGSYQQSTAAVDVAVAWHRSTPFNAVLAGREYGVPAVQMTCDQLSLSSPGARASSLSTDKLLLRESLAGSGLTAGRFAAVTSITDILAFYADRPLVLKPRSRHASLGVVRIDNRSDVESAWERCLGAATQGGLTRQRELSWALMVEELIVGLAEYSRESLVHNGELFFSNTTMKWMDVAQTFSPLGHTVPAPIRHEEEQALAYVERQLLEQIQYQSGLIHSEWIRSADGFHLVEYAVRYPGGKLAALIDKTYGVNLADGLLAALSDDFTAPPTAHPRGVAAVLFLPPTSDVAALKHLATSTDWMTVSAAVIGQTPTTAQLRNAFDRVGEVIVTAPTHKALAERVDIVRRTLASVPTAASCD